ncbi:MAG TPA: ferrous iron transport protein A [Candidatus Merdenecus merdavium]|nr:ferrous iron transport protein A [Candidatus Merdenecus merdavium]
MPLSFVKLGETKRIASLKGKDSVKRHLQDIGFNQGEEVKLLSENESGLILLIKGVRIALNRSLAEKIIVE